MKSKSLKINLGLIIFINKTMLKLLLPFCFAFFFNLQAFDLFAQKIKAITTSIEDVNNKLVVKYGLIKSKDKQRFKVALIIRGASGQIITTNALSGDIGDNIAGGPNKQIVWDYNTDKIVLDEEIKIEVVASLIKPDVGLGKALALSTLWPGWGLSKLDKKPYWLLGIAGYGCLGVSYVMNKNANSNYQYYLDNTQDELSEGFLSKSQSQNQLSKTMAYSAIGIWGINLVWTAIKAKKTNQSAISMLNKQKLFICTGFDPYTKTQGFTLRYRF